MAPQITLRERETELQALLANRAGRATLEELASRYATRNGRVWSKGTSVVTFILVYEREHGLLSG